MQEGFSCGECDRLLDERLDSCPNCGHGMLEPLTFSEYRSRRRAGQEPTTGPPAGSRARTAVLLVLAVGLMLVGVAAIGLGATVMMF